MNPITDEAKEEKDEETSDPLHEIRERYSRATEYWDEDLKAAKDDIAFRAGNQWLPEDITSRTRDKRPTLTVDKLNQYIRQIVNDGRQNRPSIKVRPVDSGADIETAEIFSGVIKHIEDSSNADAAYDTALDGAATCGRGYFMLTTEYVGDDSFDQDIRIRRIRNPLSVRTDPDSIEADGSDMKFAFIDEIMDKEDFEAQYPGKTPEDWDSEKYGDWYGDKVRIANYYEIVETDKKLYDLGNGTIATQEQIDELTKTGIPTSALNSRTIKQKKLIWRKVSGRDVLEGPTELPGQYIPLFPVYGNEIDSEGKVSYCGIIRPAKDAQRLYNYSRSAFAERVALAPKAPWVAAYGQIEDFEEEWSTANVKNHSVLRYKPTAANGQPVPPPQRQTAADVPAGFAQDMQIAEHDIQAAIGMYAASLGAPSNERSGKAIMARQREGDVGTFHYHDNLNRAIRHCGRVLVSWIPHYYDSSRVVRILGYDGTPDQVTIDPNLPKASQRVGLETMYNLGVGRYDVTISTGPSYNTLRQEAAESMVEMVQANPNLMAVIGDLMVKNMDWPGAEEISQRLKLMLPPEIKQAEQQAKQSRLTPEVQAVIAQFEQQLQQKDQMMEQASNLIEALQEEVKTLKEGHDIKENEVLIKAADTEIKAYSAETARLSAVAQAMTPEQIQQIVMQTLVDLMTPNNVPLEQGEPEMPAMPEMANVEPQSAGYPME